MQFQASGSDSIYTDSTDLLASGSIKLVEFRKSHAANSYMKSIGVAIQLHRINIGLHKLVNNEVFLNKSQQVVYNDTISKYEYLLRGICPHGLVYRNVADPHFWHAFISW